MEVFMEFLFKPINNKKQIGKRRPYSDIKFIVIHYTGNYSKGADAMAHFKYLQTATRFGSAHYFVDDRQIIQVIGDSFVAWSVGDNQGRGRYLNGCTNSNSISIEMCVNSDSDQEKVYKNTLELTKNLMKKFKIPAERVCRHYDVSRKDCPHNFRANNWSKWWRFKTDIKKPIEWQIDLSKDSEFGGEVKVEEKDYFAANGLKVIKTTADKIYIQQLGGKTLRQLGAYGINGTFFDTARPELPESTWGIAVNKGKPIGPNADRNHWKKNIKRATMIYGDGRVTVEYANNLSDIKRDKIDWAIGGVGLYPAYDPNYEQVPKDILRHTAHTGIAFKGKEIYLIVSEPCSMAVFRDKVKALGIDGAIALDGGGSTQMFYKNNFGIHTSRRLNNIVGVRL